MKTQKHFIFAALFLVGFIPSVGFTQDVDVSGGADINSDGCVNSEDFEMLRQAYGTQNPIADLDDSGLTDIKDLSLLMSRLDPFCSPGTASYSMTRFDNFNYVRPATDPSLGKEIYYLSLSASPGESEPTNFAIRAEEEIPNVSVTKNELVSADGVISADNVDIRVVDVWKQSGYSDDVDQTKPQGFLVPELLLYDDEQELSVTFDAEGKATYPSISQNLRTTVRANQTKQFWIDITVPEDAEPGRYVSTFVLTSNGNPIDAIPVFLEVLPIELAEPRQDFLMIYKSGLAEDLGEEYIRSELEEIHNHGFNGLRIQDNGDLENQIALIKEIGFPGPLVVRKNKFASVVDQIVAAGYEPIIYGQDEPNNLDQPTAFQSLRHHIARSREIHQIDDVAVSTAIRKEVFNLLETPGSAAYEQVDPDTETQSDPPAGPTFLQNGTSYERLDVPFYNANQLRLSDHGFAAPLWEYIEGLRNKTVSKTDRDEFFYWQAWQEIPHFNRLMAGYFNWTSGLQGFMTYQFMESTDDGRDPYNEYTGDLATSFRVLTMVYPSSTGPIPTLKWEEMREGIDDVRYLTTLENLINQQPTQEAAQLRAQLDAELEQYEDPRVVYELSGDDFDDTRDFIVEMILSLQ